MEVKLDSSGGHGLKILSGLKKHLFDISDSSRYVSHTAAGIIITDTPAGIIITDTLAGIIITDTPCTVTSL